MRIVSKSNKRDAIKDQLLTLIQLCFYELGQIEQDDCPVDESSSLEDVANATEALVLSLITELEALEGECTALALENVALTVKNTISDTVLQKVSMVSFDADLDAVTLDLMQSLVAAGVADTSSNREISFAPEILFSKEDLKPYLFDVIQTWINSKLK